MVYVYQEEHLKYEERQLRTLQELKAGIDAVRARNDFSNHTFYISRPYAPQHPFWYVMIRVHDLAGTDYGYSFKMDDNEARAVVTAGLLSPWFVHEKFFQTEEVNK